jgi:hypothetical protein
MSSVVISGDTSGAITLAAPSVSGTNTATLPAATGTVMVSGNQPAFYAFLNASQSISTATFTKVAFNTKTSPGYDTANCFDTTNNRFTPNVAGYYFLTCQLANGSNASRTIMTFYKNGAQYIAGPDLSYSNPNNNMASCMVYANGTTDYFEIYTYIVNAGGATVYGAANGQNSLFQGVLMRTA